MPLRISGKNIDVGEALRTRISGRVTEATEKYFDGGFSGHVTIGKDGYGFRTECVIHLDSGVVLEADAHAADAYASADQAAVRIEKRLRRYKRRLKEHPSTHGNGQAPPDLAGDEGARNGARPDRAAAAVAADVKHTDVVHETMAHADGEAPECNPVVIAEMTASIRRLSVSEAVMELDVTGAPVCVFRHAGHGRVNLVYRRADGHIGWIDPHAIDKDTH